MSAEDVAKDFISFDSSISACEKSGRWNESVDLLGSMRCQTVECIAPLPHPSLCFFFNQRFATCLVQNVLHVLRRSIAIATKVISYNSLISSCEKGGQWDLALSVLRNLRSKYLDATDAWLLCFASKRAAVTYEPIDYRPFFLSIARPRSREAISFNSCISACEACGCWTFALRLLDDISEASLVPTGVSYGAAIGACEKGEQWLLGLKGRSYWIFVNITKSENMRSVRNWALRFLTDWLKSRPDANEVTCSAAVAACVRGDCLQQAVALLRGMRTSCIVRLSD